MFNEILLLLNKMKKTAIIIGSGFSSLASAAYLAKAGIDVSVYEKNESIGGRASRLEHQGFNFDMGPTWYWMPDVFERFFGDFGRKVEEFYKLEKLDPAYQVYFGVKESIHIAGKLDEIIETFEKNEKGAGAKLRSFIKEAESNYDIAIKDLVYKPGDSILELVSLETAKRLPLFFKSISDSVRAQIKNPNLIQILEFPVLFLGAKPSDTPAFYNFMNFADFGYGTFHPMKGMHSVAEGMKNLAQELGVKFFVDSPVEKIIVEDGKAIGVIIHQKEIRADVVLSGADYHHTEQLLDSPYRMYSEKYWSKKVFAPSSLLFYVGFDKKIENVEHHTLFFDVPFADHAKDIYDTPAWPEKPLFYASFPSKTDSFFAPEGKEAGVFLIPIAPGLEDSGTQREKYFDIIIDRLESLTQQEVRSSVLFKKSFCVSDFVSRYNSYKGNAYGLANTLFQTAVFRPKLQSRKVKNLFFTGQLTVPGPGVPPALISGKIVSEKIIKLLKL